MLRHKHYVSGPDGSLIEHEGSSTVCPVPGCDWPWVEAIATTSTGDGTEITGTVKERTDVSVRLETGAGEWYWRPLDKVRPPDRLGMYCRHGLKIVEAVPAEHTCEQPQPPCDMPGEPGHRCEDHRWCKACYPDAQKVRPWPCELPGCTEADFDQGQREEEEAYYEEMRQAYYG